MILKADAIPLPRRDKINTICIAIESLKPENKAMIKIIESAMAIINPIFGDD